MLIVSDAFPVRGGCGECEGAGAATTLVRSGDCGMWEGSGTPNARWVCTHFLFLSSSHSITTHSFGRYLDNDGRISRVLPQARSRLHEVDPFCAVTLCVQVVMYCFTVLEKKQQEIQK